MTADLHPTQAASSRPERAQRSAWPRWARSSGTILAGGLVLVGLTVGCTQPAPTVNVQAPAATVGGTGPSASGISISGTGAVSGAPDTLSIAFGISLKRDTVSAAVADNASVATRVQDALKAGGIAEKDIQTSNYSVSPNFDYEQGKSVPKGFQVSNSVTVKVHDLPKAGALIDSVTQTGGNDVTVQGVSFTLEDNKALLANAREKAFADAKAKAEQFAKLSGRTLGKVDSISENADPQRFSPVAYAQSDTASGAPTPVNPGQVTSNLTITLRYSFAD